MIVYSASTVFQGETMDHYTSFATEECYEALEGFMNVCEIQARQMPLFPASNVSIRSGSFQIHPDGRVARLEVAERSFNNYEEEE